MPVTRNNALKLAMSGLLGLFAWACSGPSNIEWKEEVLLNDGRIVVIERTAEARGLNELGGPGGIRDLRMSVVLTGSHPDHPPKWDQQLVPMLLDYDAQRKEWFLIATFYMCEDWTRLGQPDLPYLEYRARSGGWQVVPLDPELYGRKANILTAPDFEDGEPPMLVLDMKKERYARGADQFKSILSSWSDAGACPGFVRK